MSDIVFTAEPAEQLTGQVRVPGDKSISHRAIMLGALAEGTTEISGFLVGEDCLATLHAYRSLGVVIDDPAEGDFKVYGVGLHGLSVPEAALDMGNAGTAMRLMTGVMTGQNFDSILTGDSSLNRRPMRRVTEPLSRMGARIETTPDGTAPLHIKGGHPLTGIDYPLPVASAQIKSCLMLAGLYAQGSTVITEPAPSRDHTERMLDAFGWPVERHDNRIAITGGGRLTGCAVDVPADPSSAAFFLVGASIARKADIILENVGINPTRTGIITLLQMMGADIELLNRRQVGSEPVADIQVRSARLRGIEIPEHLVPLAIDEFPALFIAAAVAEGKTVLTGAAELRVKESDRIQVMADGLQANGIDARATPDGMIIEGGGILSGATVDSHGDHRIAMAFAMASLRAEQPIRILDCANVNTSFPGFVRLARQAGLNISEEVRVCPPQ